MGKQLPTVTDAVAASARARAAGRGRKSPVFLWLLDRHDELLAAFSANAPAWEAIAEMLGDAGVLNGTRKKPTADGVRTTWTRVRAHVAARRASSRSTKPSDVPPPAAPATAESDQTDQAEPPKPTFKFATRPK